METQNYHQELNKKNRIKLREQLETLPSFCKSFFRGIDHIYSSRTKIAYAYDLGIFFTYLHSYHPLGKTMDIIDYPVSILDQVSREDIEDYLEYLSLYYKKREEVDSSMVKTIEESTEEILQKEVINDERGKSRKLASLRSFYNYFFRNEIIKTNPPSLVPMPKLHEKEIIRLDPNEVAQLLDQIEAGTKLTKKQSDYHAKTGKRDLAIITLLLGTGIRISECVGLNLYDLDFDNLRVKVQRKGGYEDFVYFGNEVEKALLDYLEQREEIIPCSGHEDALFLSIQKKRLTVRSIEKLVKKYSSLVTTMKKITPHKLRSTYGTTLYQETGDIYLVADVLGHKDVNTTRKHYAAMQEDNKRKAAKTIKLREP